MALLARPVQRGLAAVATRVDMGPFYFAEVLNHPHRRFLGGRGRCEVERCQAALVGLSRVEVRLGLAQFLAKLDVPRERCGVELTVDILEPGCLLLHQVGSPGGKPGDGSPKGQKWWQRQGTPGEQGHLWGSRGVFERLGRVSLVGLKFSRAGLVQSPLLPPTITYRLPHTPQPIKQRVGAAS